VAVYAAVFSFIWSRASIVRFALRCGTKCAFLTAYISWFSAHFFHEHFSLWRISRKIKGGSKVTFCTFRCFVCLFVDFPSLLHVSLPNVTSGACSSGSPADGWGRVWIGFGLGGWWFMALALGLISQPLGHLSPGPAKANLVPAGCIKIDTLTH